MESPPSALPHVGRVVRRPTKERSARRRHSTVALLALFNCKGDYVSTDVKQSSDLWQAHPEWMLRAITMHNAIVVTVVDHLHASTGAVILPGYPEGDAFLILTHPGDGAVVARAIQYALHVVREAEQYPQDHGDVLRMRPVEGGGGTTAAPPHPSLHVRIGVVGGQGQLETYTVQAYPPDFAGPGGSYDAAHRCKFTKRCVGTPVRQAEELERLSEVDGYSTLDPVTHACIKHCPNRRLGFAWSAWAPPAENDSLWAAIQHRFVRYYSTVQPGEVHAGVVAFVQSPHVEVIHVLADMQLRPFTLVKRTRAERLMLVYGGPPDDMQAVVQELVGLCLRAQQEAGAGRGPMHVGLAIIHSGGGALGAHLIATGTYVDETSTECTAYDLFGDAVNTAARCAEPDAPWSALSAPPSGTKKRKPPRMTHHGMMMGRTGVCVRVAADVFVPGDVPPFAMVLPHLCDAMELVSWRPVDKESMRLGTSGAVWVAELRSNSPTPAPPLSPPAKRLRSA